MACTDTVRSAGPITVSKKGSSSLGAAAEAVECTAGATERRHADSRPSLAAAARRAANEAVGQDTIGRSVSDATSRRTPMAAHGR
jgi:hypothetical protein